MGQILNRVSYVKKGGRQLSVELGVAQLPFTDRLPGLGEGGQEYDSLLSKSPESSGTNMHPRKTLLPSPNPRLFYMSLNFSINCSYFSQNKSEFMSL